jgi:hypothetical protein
MPPLPADRRRQLESVCVQARDVAEAAARSALLKRAVDAPEPFPHFNAAEKEQRKRLRARGRQAGDVRLANRTQAVGQLTQELAYEFWHRMLFARFLAENHLLMHPDGVAVSLEECDELAPTADPPAPNGFVLAARYASTMLPQIFRTDDVLLEVEFAPEQRLALERLLAGLPGETFLADDSLGWVYQFWQTKRKDEVNKSGEKIDGRTLPAVTQLFTEHYMVQFLLHNTIGAWWCARHGVKGPAGGAGVPAGKAPVEMEYLRWRDDGTPAAGSFDGWPKTLAEFTMLDPCCGSGHFLVSTFNLLVPLRMYDEKLSPPEACAAVLRDNLFGLELDPRCTQIAAFALALAAWKYPGADGQPLGYRPLPVLNIACSGQGVVGKREEWQALANGNSNLRFTLGNLYDLFEKAPHLGSLIDPRTELGAAGITGTLADVQPLLTKALAKHIGDADLSAVGVAAQGITRAAELLAGRYTLVMTNVPYLGRGKQNEVMKDYLQDHYPLGKADLATAFVLRCLELCRPAGSTALVTPQNWLFLTTYTKLRGKLLTEQTWNAVARLGSNAFRDMNWWAATTALITITSGKPCDTSELFGIDVSRDKAQEIKAARLSGREPTPVHVVRQADQLRNPDATVNLSTDTASGYLREFAGCYQGLTTADDGRWRRQFWEVPALNQRWRKLQTPSQEKGLFAGREDIVDAVLVTTGDHTGVIRGREAWGKLGVAIDRMGRLARSIYTGDLFHSLVPVVVAHRPEHQLAIAAFCLSDEFVGVARAANQSLSIDNGYLGKLPFDLAHWQAVAAEKYPNGLPEPHSDDPTQWLFKGDIATSTDPLQVAVARLLGYRWPDQSKEPDAVDAFVDADGIVCLPGVRGEAPVAERLLEVLRSAYQKEPRMKHGSNTDEEGMPSSDSSIRVSSVFNPWPVLSAAGCKAGSTLDDWLRNQFFDQHCKRFHQRPFIWHVWDGRKDGFSALVHYHKLNHKTLENLTYSYLGDWITAQSADAKASRTGADLRLKAAQDLQEKLKAILAGEPPYDIFVRWKPLSEQPVGWNPDLNDGVRMNIRPFVQAGVLRKTPNIKWTKDRGKEPKRDKAEYPWFWAGDTFTGERVNDVHLENAVKRAARK